MRDLRPLTTDVSPLALHTLITKAMQDQMDFETWYSRVEHILRGDYFLPVPELIFLLEAGFDYNLDNLGKRDEKRRDQNRRRLKLYLSILAGANHVPEEAKTEKYADWRARRRIEALVLRLLVKHVFDQPRSWESFRKDMRAKLIDSGIEGLVNKFFWDLFNDLWDPDVLDNLFYVFDPANRTSARWWKNDDKSKEEKAMSHFFRWFLAHAWSRHWGGKSELATKVRRKLLGWQKKTHYQFRIKTNHLPTDPWFLLFAKRQRRPRLPIQIARRKHQLRIRRTA
jgi:hypothetical protein